MDAERFSHLLEYTGASIILRLRPISSKVGLIGYSVCPIKFPANRLDASGQEARAALIIDMLRVFAAFK